METVSIEPTDISGFMAAPLSEGEPFDPSIWTTAITADLSPPRVVETTGTGRPKRGDILTIEFMGEIKKCRVSRTMGDTFWIRPLA